MLPRYYYHSQTHETRWEPPSGGFLSIKEQRELRGEKEEVVQAGSDEEEDAEEKEEREKQALLAAHQAKKQQVEQSEAHRLETTEFKIAIIIKYSLKIVLESSLFSGWSTKSSKKLLCLCMV